MSVLPVHALILWNSLLSLIAATFFFPTDAAIQKPAVSNDAPEITVTAPVPGQVLDGETITVAWTASDGDGDALVFTVEYSNDGGVIWITLAQDVTEQSVEIARTQISAGNRVRFRVWASDGVNRSVDEIDGDVVVTDWPPIVEITMPTARSFFVFGEPITFSGTAYDIDAGPIGGFALTWHSNLDGFLGYGNSLTVSTLRLGEHTISLRTPNGQGGYVEDSVAVHIFSVDHQFFLPYIVY
ncbi:MAG: Ig-like domain-containing protein [Caldilineaceae bacterium]|nr:hypothetical protein [Caldilineaceae bacterium]